MLTRLGAGHGSSRAATVKPAAAFASAVRRNLFTPPYRTVVRTRGCLLVVDEQHAFPYSWAPNADHPSGFLRPGEPLRLPAVLGSLVPSSRGHSRPPQSQHRSPPARAYSTSKIRRPERARARSRCFRARVASRSSG